MREWFDFGLGKAGESTRENYRYLMPEFRRWWAHERSWGRIGAGQRVAGSPKGEYL